MAVLPLLLCALAATGALADPEKVVVSISAGSPPVHYTDPEYLSFNFDFHYDDEEWPAWYHSSVLNMSLLDDANLTYLASQLTPGHIRVGGSEGDDLVYETPGVPCPAGTAFCLTLDRWDEINQWAVAANVTIAFGLNCMYGRPNSTAAMNLSNIEAFLAYTATKNYPNLKYFEFGNEKQDAVDADVYAKDAIAVKALITKYFPAGPTQPLMVANDENPSASYWSHMLPALPNGTIAAATWHMYLGFGLDPALPTKALNPEFLASVVNNAKSLSSTARAAGYTGDIWVGETALAWHSGRNGTTNTFLSCPWYIIQLGSFAPTHTVQCRQTLKGGYYELMDKYTEQPNPDFWVAHLWKRTMGTGVLNVTQVSGGSPSLFLFSHCTAPGSGGTAGSGVTLAFVNVSPNVTYQLSVGSSSGAALSVPRQEYHITPNGPTNSSTVLLNGDLLTYGGPGKLSPAPPVVVTDPTAPLLIAPLSVGFVVFPDAANSCTA